MYYTACTSDGCNKKVTDQGGTWRCEACNKDLPACKRRYITQFRGADSTAPAWLSTYDEQARPLAAAPLTALALLAPCLRATNLRKLRARAHPPAPLRGGPAPWPFGRTELGRARWRLRRRSSCLGALRMSCTRSRRRRVRPTARPPQA